MQNLPFFWPTKTLILDDNKLFLERVQWKNTQKCRFIFKKPLVYKPLRDFIIFRVLKNLLFSKKMGRV